jgi:hypothetical protein
MPTSRVITVLAALLLTSGCERVEYDSPTIHGQVLERDTGKPVASARVFLKEHPSVTAQTDTNGKFKLPPVRRSRLVPPVADMVVLGCCVRGVVGVQAQGHKSLEYSVDARAPDQIDVVLTVDRE